MYNAVYKIYTDSKGNVKTKSELPTPLQYPLKINSYQNKNKHDDISSKKNGMNKKNCLRFVRVICSFFFLVL